MISLPSSARSLLPLGFLSLALAISVATSGCRSLAYLDDPADGGRDGGGDDGGDGGQACSGENPQGCLDANACRPEQVCDRSVSRCLPSACTCDAATGEWSCTDDCGAGLCRPTDPAGEIVFSLSFQSDQPVGDQIYVQQSDASGHAQWIEVLGPGGVTLRIEADCGVCDCASCGPGCAVGGAGPDIVEKLVPGSQVDYAWHARGPPPPWHRSRGAARRRSARLATWNVGKRACVATRWRRT